MKVFISWSGDLSRQVAEILDEFLPCMIQDLQVFMSEHNIESGERWGLRLAKELENSEFGIICLTPDNRESPWLLYEAGALTKYIEGRACGLLLNGLKPIDVIGPLEQFHNRPFEKSEFKMLLRDVNSRVSNPLSEQKLDMVFEKWWPDLQQEYDALLKESVSNPKTPAQRNQKDLLEEVLVKVRGIERRLESFPLWPYSRRERQMAQKLAASRQKAAAAKKVGAPDPDRDFAIALADVEDTLTTVKEAKTGEPTGNEQERDGESQ